MEVLKPVKPYLEKRYEVASDRADLYAYFYELGIRTLKPGGRLGFISSSTFFRTRSGAPLRRYLTEIGEVEAVVDFNDLQIFEGVTTYPTIVVIRKKSLAKSDADGELRFLNLRSAPTDLSKHFETSAVRMPRSRLSHGTWRFESDLLDQIRAKIAAGRPKLADKYGAPLYGIKTGLNEAFIITRQQRDSLVAQDVRSADLLKPFLVGENLKRWRIEGDDQWLIYTPKNRIDIDKYPAIRGHLAPFKERLEARATTQKWWELQQAQAAYEPAFLSPKIIYPHFNDRPNFSFDEKKFYSNDKSYVIPHAPLALLALLNSKPIWFYLTGLAPAVRGGFREARVQYVGALPIDEGDSTLGDCAAAASEAAVNRHDIIAAVHHRIGDLTPTAMSILAFSKWPDLDFPSLRGLLKKRCHIDIPLAERDEWERYFNSSKLVVAALDRKISEVEAEINDRVYRLFGLTVEERAAIEDALSLTSPEIGPTAFDAISAVEGIELTNEGRARVDGAGSLGERRAAVNAAYGKTPTAG